MKERTRLYPSVYGRVLQNMLRRAPVRVAIVLPGMVLPYLQATAVARLRVYDVIEMFADDSKFLVELYVPWRKYDVVIFEKAFNESSLNLAKKLRTQGVKIILDVNVDYFSQATPRVSKRLVDLAHSFSQMSDVIIVPSQQLKKDLTERNLHKKIMYVPEPIPYRYFIKKKESFSIIPKLVWCGYHTKAGELKSIGSTLVQILRKYDTQLTIISDKKPDIDVNFIFRKYSEKQVVSDLQKSDVFIAPRSLNKDYKYHHTFSKIGLPMAVGLPVVASPVPSYMNSPAILCKDDNEWIHTFENIFKGKINLQELSEKGRDYCKREYSWDNIRQYYQGVLESVLQ